MLFKVLPPIKCQGFGHKGILLGLIFMFIAISCSDTSDLTHQGNQTLNTEQEMPLINRKRVLLVNSYHQGYFWTSGITNAVLDQFGASMDSQGRVDNSKSRAILEIVDMDTKRNQSEEYIQKTAIDIIRHIESWQPDVVITSDDNAAKYIIPYFKNTRLPFVFCGVNWDAGDYDFPASHVTGMIEVQLIDQIIKTLKTYAKGDRIAILKGDDSSARKEALFFENHFHLSLDKRFVKTFLEWKDQYQRLQHEADMILVGNTAAIPDWNAEQALQMIHGVTAVPTGNWDDSMKRFSLLTFATKPEEQGNWAADTAIKIIGGVSPSAIPLTKNKIANVYLNMTLAKRLGIKFPLELIDRATFVQ